MTVNVSMKKFVVFLVLFGIICGGIWWYMETAPARKAKAEIKLMIDYVQRQALEIAIIEQSSKLADYRQQMEAAKKAPLPFAPISPVIPDPNS